jgi:hypothetical protein
MICNKHVTFLTVSTLIKIDRIRKVLREVLDEETTRHTRECSVVIIRNLKGGVSATVLLLLLLFV